MSLAEYLERHIVLSDEHTSHKRLVDEIGAHPELIGIEDYSGLYREVALVKSWGKIGIVDLVVLAQGGLWVIKATAPRSGRRIDLKRLRGQLNMAYKFFREEFDVSPRMMEVYRRIGENVIHHKEYVNK